MKTMEKDEFDEKDWLRYPVPNDFNRQLLDRVCEKTGAFIGKGYMKFIESNFKCWIVYVPKNSIPRFIDLLWLAHEVDFAEYKAACLRRTLEYWKSENLEYNPSIDEYQQEQECDAGTARDKFEAEMKK